MSGYDKDKIKERLTIDQYYDIFQALGGEPKYTSFGLISRTICHNPAHKGSYKLYFYTNSSLCRCYTGCDCSFDIFDLVTKAKTLSQPDIKWDLYTSIKWIAARYGWETTDNETPEEKVLPDWAIFDKYEKLAQDVDVNVDINSVVLPEYDDTILKNLSYPQISSWVSEGISPKAIKEYQIGYYASGEQITIPHYDINGRFVGLRGRSISKEAAQLYGKYRPVCAGGILYNHPLGLNLYGLNKSKSSITAARKAIIVEGEKSVLLYGSYFGIDNNICVACCGSAVSAFQIKLLLSLGVNEIIIGFDKQFQEIGDEEFKHLTKNLKSIHKRFSPYVTVSFLFDKYDLLNYKDSPLDRGKDIFLELYKKRIFL